MEKIIALYNPQRAEEDLARLNFEKKEIEDDEYLASWIAGTLGLSSREEKNIREELGVPQGRFVNLIGRINTMEKYTQPTMLGGKK